MINIKLNYDTALRYLTKTKGLNKVVSKKLLNKFIKDIFVFDDDVLEDYTNKYFIERGNNNGN